MKQKRFKEEQIAFTLWQAESGVPVGKSIGRRNKGADLPELHELRQHREKNCKLKQMVAAFSYRGFFQMEV